MDVINSIIGGGGQGAQPGKPMPQQPVVADGSPGKPVAPNAPGQPGFAGAVRGGAQAVQQMEHPAWAVIDKLAGGDDRTGFAQNNPQIMQMVKSYFE